MVYCMLRNDYIIGSPSVLDKLPCFFIWFIDSWDWGVLRNARNNKSLAYKVIYYWLYPS